MSYAIIGELGGEPSSTVVAQAFAERLGFSPIELGGLSEGGLLVQARGIRWGHVIFEDLVTFD